MRPIERMLLPAAMMLVVSSSACMPTTMRLREVFGLALQEGVEGVERADAEAAGLDDVVPGRAVIGLDDAPGPSRIA